MKKIIALIGILGIGGCAAAGIISDGMQPDGTYRILSNGNLYASKDDIIQAAHNRASGLCPNGYKLKSEMCGGSGVNMRCQVIVKCDD